MSDISTIIANTQNFKAMRGDTFGPIVLQFFNSVNSVETPVDITGDDFNMVVAPSRTATPVLIFGIGSGLVIQNTNELVISKPASAMEIEARAYRYDLEWTEASGVVSTALTGMFTIQEDITP